MLARTDGDVGWGDPSGGEPAEPSEAVHNGRAPAGEPIRDR
jgi:hypothetical protein